MNLNSLSIFQAYYITTARELARMIGIQKSPIQHHFSESISGASTIRCFNQETRFMNKCFRVIDNYSRVTFHCTATMEWLCVRINFLFNLVFFILLVILVHLPRASIDPSNILYQNWQIGWVTRVKTSFLVWVFWLASKQFCFIQRENVTKT